MTRKSERTMRVKIANIFGSLGYVVCFLQWLWAVLLYFSLIQAIVLFLSPTPSKRADQAPEAIFALPDPIGSVVLVIITAAMIAVTVYVLVKMPAKIAKDSKNIVHKTSKTVVPIVIKSQHKKDTKKERTRMTPRILFIIKSLAVSIPALFTVGSVLLENQAIDYTVAIVIGGGLAWLSVLFFAIQYLLARFLRVNVSKLW